MPRNSKYGAESGVLRACLDLLAAERIWHCRMNTGAVKDGGRFFRFGRKGMADILASPKLPIYLMPATWDRIDYAFLWIECKSSNGKQTEAQKEFQKEVEAESHTYLLIRDVSELQKWLKKIR
jgi:hypothetical protein